MNTETFTLLSKAPECAISCTLGFLVMCNLLHSRVRDYSWEEGAFASRG
jgi:hypothetical protein